jgi:hypothetical protein
VNKVGRNLQRRTSLLVTAADQQRERLVAAGATLTRMAGAVQRSVSAARHLPGIWRLISRILQR